MRFAASRALNDSAFAARQAHVDEVERLFTIRRKWTLTGFKVKRSTKTRMVARVGTIRQYLVDHVRGGTRRHKAIPTRALRKSKKKVIGRARWPGKLRSKPRHFTVDPAKNPEMLPDSHKRHGKRGRIVFRRLGRGRNQRARMLWILPDRIKIKKRYRFNRVSQKALARTYPEAFPKRLMEALATAR